jgi:hypothetical protein
MCISSPSVSASGTSASQLSRCALPLASGQRVALHPLRLADVRQLRAVEVGKPPPDFREREAGKFFVQRVMPARIDDDKAIPPVARCQHQARRIERRPEGLAVLRAMQAIENRVADRLEVMPREASSS